MVIATGVDAYGPFTTTAGSMAIRKASFGREALTAGERLVAEPQPGMQLNSESSLDLVMTIVLT